MVLSSLGRIWRASNGLRNAVLLSPVAIAEDVMSRTWKRSREWRSSVPKDSARKPDNSLRLIELFFIIANDKVVPLTKRTVQGRLNRGKENFIVG